MEYHVTKNLETGWYTVTISGEVTPQDLPNMLSQLWAMPDYVSATHAVWDFSNSQTNYHFQDIFNLFKYVKQNKNRRGPTILAVVAPKDLEYGMTRMYASLGEVIEPRVEVFRTRHEAEHWLRNS